MPNPPSVRDRDLTTGGRTGRVNKPMTVPEERPPSRDKPERHGRRARLASGERVSEESKLSANASSVSAESELSGSGSQGRRLRKRRNAVSQKCVKVSSGASSSHGRSGEGRRSSGARGPRQGSRRVVPPQPSAAEPRRSRGGQAYCSKERLGQQTHEGLPRVAGNGEGQGGEGPATATQPQGAQGLGSGREGTEADARR